MKKIHIVFLLSIFLFSFTILNSQNLIYSEAPIIFENGVKKSVQVTVHFNSNVFALPKGKKYAEISDANHIYSNVINTLVSLQLKYGEVILKKQIPTAVWGDIWRKKITNGEMVKINDMSQLFTLSFTRFVPVDSIINSLNQLEEVKYAHQPIETISLIEPDDEFYSAQWNLSKINAPAAWDITKGIGNVKIGIVTQDGVDRNHPDLEDKFTHLEGDQTFILSHGTQVAGIAGASTDNNSEGIASLGWNLKLNPYHYTPGPPPGEGGGNLPTKIQEAMDDGCRVINFSFATGTTRARPECGDLGVFRICHIWESENYGSVGIIIQNALDLDIVITAAVGNGSVNLTQNSNFLWCDTQIEGCDDVFPYEAYPAKYQGVIGVSATDMNDNFAGGGNFNYGDFVDISAPGMSVLSTTLEDDYITVSGTSFSAPLVAALAGLICSLNPSIEVNEVEVIIKNTALDLGETGWDEFYGEGRIDAYTALLETIIRMADEDKSSDNAATGINNGRRLVKDQNGDYHLVFTSGNNIFYRKSTDNGNSWSSSVHLSTSFGQNKYPSIATHGNFIFVTWQQYNGYDGNDHNYNIIGKWKNLSGTNWKALQITTPLVLFPSETDPTPVVLAADNVDNNYQSTQNAPEVMIAFRKSDGIYHTNLFYIDPQSETKLERSYVQLGTIHKIPNTLSGYANPSLTINDAGKIMLTCNSSGLLYAFTSTGSSWSAFPSSIFNVGGVIYPKYSSVTIDGLDDFHISWEGYKYTYGADEILHKKILSNGGTGTPITEFRYTGPNKDSHQPSTFGHIDGNGGVSIYWFTEDNEITRVINDGTGWDYSGFVFFPYIQTDASYVNSISKDNPNNYAYCWTSTGESPYVYNTSINSTPFKPLSMRGGNPPMEMGNESLTTYRRAELNIPDLDVILSLQIGNFAIVDEDENRFQLDVDRLDPQFTFEKFKDILETVLSDSIPNSNNLNSIEFDYSITTKNLFEIKAGNSNVKVKFILKNRGNGNSHYSSEYFILAEDSSLNTLSGTLSIPLNRLNENNDLSVKLKLTGVKQNFLNHSENINLINTYLYGSGSLPKGSGVENDLVVNKEFMLEQNYPNPFNPTTTISYSILETGLVSLRVYDILGKEVATLVNENKTAGSYSVEFDGVQLSSGIYFYKLSSGQFTSVKKLILLK